MPSAGGGEEHPFAGEREFGAADHLAFGHLDVVAPPFGGAGVPMTGQPWTTASQSFSRPVAKRPGSCSACTLTPQSFRQPAGAGGEDPGEAADD